MATANSLFIVAIVFCAGIIHANGQATVARAIMFQAANFNTGEALRSVGTIELTQQSGSNTVQMRGRLVEINQGAHAFHVHERGDLGNMCMNAGEHFNPDGHNHGAPTDTRRHVGDLGNINAAADKTVTISIDDTMAQLSGRNSIIGRALVIHEKPDDMGKAGTNDSLMTGSSGSRIACGVIAIANDGYLADGSSSSHNGSTSSFTASALFLYALIALIAIACQQVC